MIAMIFRILLIFVLLLFASSPLRAYVERHMKVRVWDLWRVPDLILIGAYLCKSVINLTAPISRLLVLSSGALDLFGGKKAIWRGANFVAPTLVDKQCKWFLGLRNTNRQISFLFTLCRIRRRPNLRVWSEEHKTNKADHWVCPEFACVWLGNVILWARHNSVRIRFMSLDARPEIGGKARNRPKSYIHYTVSRPVLQTWLGADCFRMADSFVVDRAPTCSWCRIRWLPWSCRYVPHASD